MGAHTCLWGAPVAARPLSHRAQARPAVVAQAVSAPPAPAKTQLNTSRSEEARARLFCPANGCWGLRACLPAARRTLLVSRTVRLQ